MDTALLHGFANYDPLAIELAKMSQGERQKYFEKVRNRKAITNPHKVARKEKYEYFSQSK